LLMIAHAIARGSNGSAVPILSPEQRVLGERPPVWICGNCWAKLLVIASFLFREEEWEFDTAKEKWEGFHTGTGAPKAVPMRATTVMCLNCILRLDLMFAGWRCSLWLSLDVLVHGMKRAEGVDLYTLANTAISQIDFSGSKITSSTDPLKGQKLSYRFRSLDMEILSGNVQYASTSPSSIKERYDRQEIRLKRHSF